MTPLDAGGYEHRAKDADGTPLSDEAVAIDFAIHCDFCSMCQEENDQRTEVSGIFRRLLSTRRGLRYSKLMRTTRVPEGLELDRT